MLCASEEGSKFLRLFERPDLSFVLADRWRHGYVRTDTSHIHVLLEIRVVRRSPVSCCMFSDIESVTGVVWQEQPILLALASHCISVSLRQYKRAAVFTVLPVHSSWDTLIEGKMKLSESSFMLLQPAVVTFQALQPQFTQLKHWNDPFSLGIP